MALKPQLVPYSDEKKNKYSDKISGINSYARFMTTHGVKEKCFENKISFFRFSSVKRKILKAE